MPSASLNFDRSSVMLIDHSSLVKGLAHQTKTCSVVNVHVSMYMYVYQFFNTDLITSSSF